jgi:nucleoside-diphosphate-sugar epimerase
MNKVFVTGADGLLGSMVCRMLLEQEYEVTALCLREAVPRRFLIFLLIVLKVIYSIGIC